MRYYVTDQCNSCMDCLETCPVHAIRTPGLRFFYAGEEHSPLSYEFPFIVQEACDGCVEHVAPICVETCAVQAIFTNMLE